MRTVVLLVLAALVVLAVVFGKDTFTAFRDWLRCASPTVQTVRCWGVLTSARFASSAEHKKAPNTKRTRRVASPFSHPAEA